MGDQGRGGGPARGPSPLAYVGLGFEIAVPLAIGVLLGHWADRRLGTEPWILLAGALLGMAAGFFNFFRTVLPSRRDGRGGSA